MVDQHSTRPAAAHTAAPVVTSSLYEAAFSTTGPNPRCGVALTRTIEEARQSLANMLLLCDPATPAVADIVEFTRAQTVSRYIGTVGDVFAQLTNETPAIDHYTGTAGDIAAQISDEDAR
jgi:hypothetical protein